MSDDIYKRQVGGTHYSSMIIQPSEFINRNNIPFAEGNAIKYLCRHKQKNQKQDLEKQFIIARWQLTVIIQRIKKKKINQHQTHGE